MYQFKFAWLQVAVWQHFLRVHISLKIPIPVFYVMLVECPFNSPPPFLNPSPNVKVFLKLKYESQNTSSECELDEIVSPFHWIAEQMQQNDKLILPIQANGIFEELLVIIEPLLYLLSLRATFHHTTQEILLSYSKFGPTKRSECQFS